MELSNDALGRALLELLRTAQVRLGAEGAASIPSSSLVGLANSLRSYAVRLNALELAYEDGRVPAMGVQERLAALELRFEQMEGRLDDLEVAMIDLVPRVSAVESGCAPV